MMYSRFLSQMVYNKWERRLSLHMGNKTLGDKVADKLMNLIREQGYESGEKLPNEYELSSLLGVSRNTIREALRVLAYRNIVSIRQGAGTFISNKMGVVDDPLGFSLMEDQQKLVEDLMQVRYIIEPQIAALATQNATAEDITILGDLCDEMEVLFSEGKDFTQKDIEFHSHLASCSKNTVMSNLIPVICNGITAFSSMGIEEDLNQTIRSHRKLFESIRNRRAADAQQTMLYHLLYNLNYFKGKKNL